MDQPGVVFTHRGYTVRQWSPGDREAVAQIIKGCLESYGLPFEPQGTDLDAIEVEEHYLKGDRGEFWVVVDDSSNRVVGTGGYHEVPPWPECGGGCEVVRAVEIRKMYLLQEARGKGLGRTMLEELEKRIRTKGYTKIYIETATVLFEACKLYQSSGYVPVLGCETVRCDKRLQKIINQD